MLIVSLNIRDSSMKIRMTRGIWVSSFILGTRRKLFCG
nr:MAG TPA: hypothetical protein [Caudoviricetes sp.]